mmetsp:Transcript_21779/g.33073  ORF Transcript_21779/g.33073 Transcript_21779/m.33073 type:complete len:175 (-) Transcript_21779:66-590(-)|eukprot:CAMPEP_0194204332 /NCGR_PEP_ID=MMETSP0156-20130528/3889_1 /TAXON_ID=33649 /ORGANISM="Thalassionema nitzschioides, Strain L26-B" /LENGTH=174 /DNA_ID=CAMNT_0038930321 /DNA_START=62 /DNA_END=586 /DNA_ORIENTATION=+
MKSQHSLDTKATEENTEHNTGSLVELSRQPHNCDCFEGSSTRVLEDLSMLANVRFENVLQKLSDVDDLLGESDDELDYDLNSFLNHEQSFLHESVKETSSKEQVDEVRLGDVLLKVLDIDYLVECDECPECDESIVDKDGKSNKNVLELSKRKPSMNNLLEGLPCIRVNCTAAA